MKRITVFLFSCMLGTGISFAQQGTTQCGVPTGQAPYPVNSYIELPDPVQPSAQEWVAVKSPHTSWGTTDVHYAKHTVPGLKQQNTLRLRAWRGERVNAQAVVWTGREVKELNCSLTDLKNNKGDLIPADACNLGFVRYVMTDELNKDKKGGCGYRPDHSLFDSLLVADPIIIPYRICNFCQCLHNLFG